ncbi:MAG: glycosyltransferase family 4 protein [Methylobacterium mesophilicum]|nr:glycosyltransferase family 4 protein [Methylobacterium mesophilicum]
MSRRGSPARCLICCPLPYVGRGWPQTAVEVAQNFSGAGLEPVLVTPRLRKALPPSLRAVETMGFPFSRLPWRMVKARALASFHERFARMLREADPTRTIAYFWPGSPPHLVQAARRAGIVSVREMINTYQGTAKRLLDEAYGKLDLPAGHPITEQAVRDEKEELRLYDRVFAPSPLVKASLIEAGIPESRILLSSYGWSPERFGAAPVRQGLPERPFRALFVGLACVRKGVPELLEAWDKSGVAGELLLVGDVEPALRARVEAAVARGQVRHLPFTQDLAAHYRDADIFVFPSHEEGCPQVTMEAAGCGLPVLATPMGAAGLVEDGRNGLVVSAGDVDGLSRALARLARDRALRETFSARIARDAQRFTYARVSAARAGTLADLLPMPGSSLAGIRLDQPATA